MIRFRCTNCQREYELPDALFGLPLVCKSCGQSLVLPEPSADAPLDLTVPTVESPREDAPDITLDVGKTAAEDVEMGFLSPGTIAKLDEPPDVAPLPKAWAKPLPPPQPAMRTASPLGRTLLSYAADAGVVLVLLVVGVLLGEFAAGQSTREVLAGINGPKFPSLELLLWLAGPAVLLLIYVLLGSRQKTVGAWLRRRG